MLSGASKAGIVVEPGSPVETALAYHGVPYLWAGATPSGFDCSGLILYVYKQHGVTLPHYSGSQFLLGEKVAYADLQPGDVVFFGSPIHHVGMYIGGGYFLHAPRTGDFVKITKLADAQRLRRRPPLPVGVPRRRPAQGRDHHGQGAHQGSASAKCATSPTHRKPRLAGLLFLRGRSRPPMSGKIHVLRPRARRDGPV